MENKCASNVCMPSFPADVEPPPQSEANVERSINKAAWHEAMNIELDRHKTSGTYETATPPLGWKSVGVKWVFTYKTGKDGLIVKTKPRLVAKGYGHGAGCSSNVRTNSLVSSR